tara:strand:+ start:38 stop:244 length:207 start_codon:yes stop_codon:yes gene_type:complete
VEGVVAKELHLLLLQVEVEQVVLEHLFQVEQKFIYNQDQMQLQLEQVVQVLLLQVLQELAEQIQYLET